MNKQTLFNVGLFVLLAAAGTGIYWFVDSTWLHPKKPEVVKEPPPPALESAMGLVGSAIAPTELATKWPARGYPVSFLNPPPAREGLLAVTGAAPSLAKGLERWPWFTRFVPTEAEAPPQPAKTAEPHRLIALGGDGFFKRVLLTSEGAGVQQVVLPAFDEGTRLGVAAKDADGKPLPLHLIPGTVRPRDPTAIGSEVPYVALAPTPAGQTVPKEMLAVLAEPSYALLHYDGDPTQGDEPARQNPPPGYLPNAHRYPSSELATRTWKVVSESPDSETGEAKVVFETDLEKSTDRDGKEHDYHIRIRKTFTLAPHDYHIGMALEFSAMPTGRAVAGQAKKLRYQIVGPRGLPMEQAEWTGQGGYRNTVVGTLSGRDAHRDIRTADVTQGESGGPPVAKAGETFTYAGVTTQFFASAMCLDPDQPEDVRKGMWAYVRSTRESSPAPQGVKEPAQLSDVTVRAVSNPIDPQANAPVVHRYMIYDGPVKVRLLKHLDLLDDHRGTPVDAALVDKYLDAMTLKTLTDYHGANWMGEFAGFIHWTDLVVWFTNLMHEGLGLLHKAVPVWGLDILLLTVMVRLLLMYPSRKQQAVMAKTQAKMAKLKPEMDKLAEQFKGDPQRLQQEKSRLMLAHGVNPASSMGGCLLMVLQMPIFMGLYFCLQESVFFRLSPFLWIKNLAAPDMLLWWTEQIPFVSKTDSLGAFYYLGPFLNILPIVAVSLMFLNQVLSAPPKTNPPDEQMEMNQRMMKIMMVVMAVMFYKMASGMCLYFIVSTGWGLLERLIFKKKKAELDATLAASSTGTPVYTPASAAGGNGSGKPTAPAGGGFLGRLMARVEEMKKDAESQSQRQIVNNPQPPKPGANGAADRGGGPNGKKKKRKK